MTYSITIIDFGVIGSILLAVIWICLPIESYKKPIIRRIGYFITLLMFVLFLGSISMLFEFFTCKEECFTLWALFLGFFTAVLILSIPCIILSLISKTKKALKQLKAEGWLPEPRQERRAIASFVLGAINLIWGGAFCIYFLQFYDIHSKILDTIFLWQFSISNLLLELGWIILLFPLIIPLIGIILGIMGFKSTKRIYAIIGIVLSVISIPLTLFQLVVVFFALSLAHGS